MGIAAVVVTYNRKQLLLKNVAATLTQTRRPDVVYVIDNCSTDGTEEALRAAGMLDHVMYRRMATNLGGAGGFHEGIKLAHGSGHAKLWLMDDDGCPDPTCLEELLRNQGDYDVVGPLIYCELPDVSHSVYTCGRTRTEDLATLRAAREMTPVHPFNGILMNREVVDRIGLPEARLFLWGDEQDYRLRWLKAGFREVSFSSALYFHPRNRLKFRQHGPLLKTPDIPSERKYLFYRNQAWIDRRHRSPLAGVASIVRWAASILLCEQERWSSLSGLYDGLRGDLSDPRLRRTPVSNAPAPGDKGR